MRENCRGVAACVKFVDRRAAHCHFLPFLDNRFNSAQGEAAEAAHQNIREAQAFGAHWLAVGQRENVMRRDVERLFV